MKSSSVFIDVVVRAYEDRQQVDRRQRGRDIGPYIDIAAGTGTNTDTDRERLRVYFRLVVTTLLEAFGRWPPNYFFWIFFY
jgi:hypothetical protein